MIDPKSRFSNRVDDYVRYRPTYPTELLRVLENDAGLTSAAAIADIGSGTGISSKLFLEHGNTVYGVEPNREMRAAAEKLLDGNAKFHSNDGSAGANHPARWKPRFRRGWPGISLVRSDEGSERVFPYFEVWRLGGADVEFPTHRQHALPM